MLSTGEAPATSFTNDGGTHGRVLTLWGHPFGRADETTAPVVQRVNHSLFTQKRRVILFEPDRIKVREHKLAYQEKSPGWMKGHKHNLLK
jgi:hypothetical protein